MGKRRDSFVSAKQYVSVTSHEDLPGIEVVRHQPNLHVSHSKRWSPAPAVALWNWNKATVPHHHHSMSQEEGSSIKKGSKRPSYCIAILIGLFVMLTVVALGVTLVVMLTGKKTSLVDTMDAFDVQVSLDQEFTAGLADPNSQEWHELAISTCLQVDAMYQAGQLSQRYEGCVVNDFSAGSVVVNYTALFSNSENVHLTRVPKGSKMDPMLYTVMMFTEEHIGSFLDVTNAPITVVVSADNSILSELQSDVEIVESQPQDDCASAPCLHNGVCTDGIMKYFCACTESYTGHSCGIDITECGQSVCSGHGECIEIVGGDIYCNCEPGYTSADCSVDINECDSDPCLAGTCTNLIANFSCACDPGYGGKECDIDVDECASGPCGFGTCIDEHNHFICDCTPGYHGITCDSEINECSTNPCIHGNCTDLIDGFSCACDDGYYGNTCALDFDDCSAAPCVYGTCLDEIDHFVCLCHPGYTGITCDSEINECSTNPCIHGNCTDLIDGFSCACDVGFYGNTCGFDFDDCSAAPCVYGTCLDEIDHFVCMCIPGYTGTLCDIDIDDCDPDPCNRHGSCIDQVNGFSCDCYDNYMGTTCCVFVPGNCKMSSPCGIDEIANDPSDIEGDLRAPTDLFHECGREIIVTSPGWNGCSDYPRGANVNASISLDNSIYSSFNLTFLYFDLSDCWSDGIYDALEVYGDQYCNWGSTYYQGTTVRHAIRSAPPFGTGVISLGFFSDNCCDENLGFIISLQFDYSTYVNAPNNA